MSLGAGGRSKTVPKLKCDRMERCGWFADSCVGFALHPPPCSHELQVERDPVRFIRKCELVRTDDGFRIEARARHPHWGYALFSDC